MGLITRKFDRAGTPLLAGMFILLFYLEGKYRLRKRVQNRWKRAFINSAVSVPAFTLLRFMFLPTVVWLARRRMNTGSRVFFLPGLSLTNPLNQALAFLFLDYTNYLWHRLNHIIPFLWRFHLVHHTDKDLDITTAFRFHFGEMIGSLFYRGAFTYLSGATPLTVILYEIAFEGATEFHHSNMKMPLNVEKLLNLVFVTPRMHGIHHSVNRNETDSNYSVIFSFWDRLHRTAKLDVPQSNIIIGVPVYPDAAELSIPFLLKLPFTKIRKWEH